MKRWGDIILFSVYVVVFLYISGRIGSELSSCRQSESLSSLCIESLLSRTIAFRSVAGAVGSFNEVICTLFTSLGTAAEFLCFTLVSVSILNDVIYGLSIPLSFSSSSSSYDICSSASGEAWFSFYDSCSAGFSSSSSSGEIYSVSLSSSSCSGETDSSGGLDSY